MIGRGAELRVADVIRHHAAERGGGPALVHVDRELTYAELDRRSNQLAHALIARGAGPGSRIAYLDRAAPEAIELLFAASKIGAVAVPLNWRLAEPELAAILTDAHAAVLIAGGEYRAVARRLADAAAAPLDLLLVGEDGPLGYARLP